jgi:hypothetical protein
MAAGYLAGWNAGYLAALAAAQPLTEEENNRDRS